MIDFHYNKATCSQMNNEHQHETRAIHKVAIDRNAISFALMCDALHCIINFQ